MNGELDLCRQLCNEVLARVVRARDALEDGELALAAAALESAETDLVAIIDLVVHARVRGEA